MVEEACLGGPGEYELCIIEAQGVYDQCMVYVWEWAYSNCAGNWNELNNFDQCVDACGIWDIMCLEDCMFGNYEQNYFIFYCVQPLLWQGMQECSTIQENYFYSCCYGTSEND